VLTYSSIRDIIIIALVMEAVITSGKLDDFYETARHIIPENSHL
jgi:hypothetical protein